MACAELPGFPAQSRPGELRGEFCGRAVVASGHCRLPGGETALQYLKGKRRVSISIITTILVIILSL